jgi:signal transduction histidine kinase
MTNPSPSPTTQSHRPSNSEQRVAALNSIEELKGLTLEELRWIADASTERSVQDGELIFSQEAPPQLTKNDTRYQLGLRLSDQTVLDRYLKGLEVIRSRVRSGLHPSTSILAAELEETLIDWLEGKRLEEAWKLAPILAEAEVSIPQLQDFIAPVPPEFQPIALRDLLATLSQDAAIISVTRATERIFQIVSAVKDYSYMDREPLQEINIPHALDIVLMMFQTRLKDVIIRRNFAPDLPRLRGFGSELNQALSSLIENSLDAMGNNGTLTLSVKLQGKTLLIDIEDDGRGIPKESQDRVFEPFFTTKPFGGGLGLGLDTVQRVVAKHFGAVAFDTSTHGTTFHVRLPLDRVEIY